MKILTAGLFLSLLSPQAQAASPHGVPSSGGPVVSLNFATNTATGCSSLTSCLSVKRTTQETCEPAGGQISYARPGNLCITSEGVQLFGAGTNLVAHSQDVKGWTVSANDTFATSGAAPDGSSGALTLTDSANNQGHYVITPSFSVKARKPYVVSFFAAAGVCAQASGECHFGGIIGTTANFLSAGGGLIFDAAACTWVGGSTHVLKAMPPKKFVSGGKTWCRFAFVVLAGAIGGNVNFKISMMPGIPSNAYDSRRFAPTYTGAESSVELWGLDVKQGSILLPYCPSSIGTCNADVVSDAGSDATLKNTLEGSALRVVAQVTEFYDEQPPPTATGYAPSAHTILGVGPGLAALGVASGFRAQTNWPNTATLTSGGKILRYLNTNYFGLSADSRGRSMVLNGQTPNTDSNGPSGSSLEYLGSLSSGSAPCNCIIASLQVWDSRNDAAMAAATANSNALPLLPSYTGVVANHAQINEGTLPGTQSLSRSHHRVTENITAIQIIFGNYYAHQGTESEMAPGAATPIEAVIEYPLGSCHAFHFNGSFGGGTIANRGQLATDLLPISIPAGSDIWLWEYRTNAAGVMVSNGNNNVRDTVTGGGEYINVGASVANPLLDGNSDCSSWTKPKGSGAYYPDAIVGPTVNHSYCLQGDSRLNGYGNNAANQSLDANDTVGAVDPWLNPYYSTLKIALGGDAAFHFSNNHATKTVTTNRLALWRYCSGLIVEYGGNDIFQKGSSLSTLEKDLRTIYGFARSRLRGGLGGPIFQTTTFTQSFSFDNWQSVNCSPPQNACFNGSPTGGQYLDRYAAAAANLGPGPSPAPGTLNHWIKNKAVASGYINGYLDIAGTPINVLQQDGVTYVWCALFNTAVQAASVGAGAAVNALCTADGLHPSAYGYNVISNAMGFKVLQ